MTRHLFLVTQLIGMDTTEQDTLTAVITRTVTWFRGKDFVGAVFYRGRGI